MPPANSHGDGRIWKDWDRIEKNHARREELYKQLPMQTHYRTAPDGQLLDEQIQEITGYGRWSGNDTFSFTDWWQIQSRKATKHGQITGITGV